MLNKKQNFIYRLLVPAFVLAFGLSLSFPMPVTAAASVISVQGCPTTSVSSSCKIGEVTRGQYIIVRGSGFTDGGAVPSIYINVGNFGSMKIDPISSSSTQLTAVVPANLPLGERFGTVVVNNEDSNTFNLTVVDASSAGPNIDRVGGCELNGDESTCVDNVVAVGKLLVVQGNFPAPADYKILIGNLRLTPTFQSSEEMAMRPLPTSVTPGNYTLRVGRVSTSGTVTTASNSVSITVTEAAAAYPTPSGGQGGDQALCPAAFTGTPPLIQIGSTNSGCVKLIQRKLGRTEDGVFNTALQTAVRAYQVSFGASQACQDGKVEHQTWSKLLNRQYTTSNACYTAPASGGGGNNSGSVGGFTDADCQPLGLVAVNGLCLPASAQTTGSGLVSCSSVGACLNSIIRILLTLAGIVAILFIIIGGFRYITSAGNPASAEKGKKTLINAIIGLAAILLAYTLVSVVYNSLTRGI